MITIARLTHPEQASTTPGQRSATIRLEDDTLWQLTGDLPLHIDRQVELVVNHVRRGRIETELLDLVRGIVADAERGVTEHSTPQDRPTSWLAHAGATAGVGGLF